MYEGPPYKRQKTGHDDMTHVSPHVQPLYAASASPVVWIHQPLVQLSVPVSQDFPKNVPEIDPNEVERKELLGEGSFGLVYRGKCRGQEVAIKYLKESIEDPKILEDFKREVK